MTHVISLLTTIFLFCATDQGLEFFWEETVPDEEADYGDTVELPEGLAVSLTVLTRANHRSISYSGPCNLTPLYFTIIPSILSPPISDTSLYVLYIPPF